MTKDLQVVQECQKQMKAGERITDKWHAEETPDGILQTPKTCTEVSQFGVLQKKADDRHLAAIDDIHQSQSSRCCDRQSRPCENLIAS